MRDGGVCEVDAVAMFERTVARMLHARGILSVIVCCSFGRDTIGRKCYLEGHEVAELSYLRGKEGAMLLIQMLDRRLDEIADRAQNKTSIKVETVRLKQV